MTILSLNWASTLQ